MCLKNFRRILLTLSWHSSYHIETSPLICSAKSIERFFCHGELRHGRVQALTDMSSKCYCCFQLFADIFGRGLWLLLFYSTKTIYQKLFFWIIAKRSTKKSRNLAWRCGVNKQIMTQMKGSLKLIVSNLKPLTTCVPHHIETSQLICRANQLTGFYMMGNNGRLIGFSR